MARDYNTRQKALVLQALMDMGERAVTVEELMEGLRRKDSRVGRATVYRQLDRLVEAGKARTPAGARGGAVPIRGRRQCLRPSPALSLPSSAGGCTTWSANACRR